MTTLIVVFRYFANAPKYVTYTSSSYLFFLGSPKLSRFYNKTVKFLWSIVSWTVNNTRLKIHFILLYSTQLQI